MVNDNPSPTGLADAPPTRRAFTEATMRVIDRGCVLQGEPKTDRSSCAFPNACVAPNGRWLCALRAAPTKAGTIGQQTLLTASDDEGRSWSEPNPAPDPPLIDGRPGLFRGAAPTALPDGRVLLTLYWVDHSDPSLPFFNEQTQGLLDSRIFHAWSKDAGLTWSTPALVDTTPFNQPTPITGPTLALPDGRLACQFELNKHYDDPSPWRHQPVILFSSDGGKTWPEHAIPAADPDNHVFYWDQRPAVMAEGRLLNLFWTYDTARSTYLPIHAGESLDGGRTWSQPWDTHVPGQAAQPVQLPDGRIAMVYVDRTGPPTIKARVSSDGGRTWPAETELVIDRPAEHAQTQRRASTEETWAEMEAFSIGLPATAPLPDGEVLVVYYAGPEPDHTDVRWARLRVD